MTAHTPGKWGFDDEWVFSDSHLAGKGDIVCLNPALDGFEHSAKRWEANARLIAAAPELLEALERIARPHDCGCKPCTGACRNQLALEITVEEIQELARAAIAKAKGESA